MTKQLVYKNISALCVLYTSMFEYSLLADKVDRFNLNETLLLYQVMLYSLIYTVYYDL